jgi:hypothetical protein
VPRSPGPHQRFLGSGSAPANLNDSGAQLLTLLAACVHERRHRGVTPTIDDIPDNLSGCRCSTCAPVNPAR